MKLNFKLFFFGDFPELRLPKKSHTLNHIKINIKKLTRTRKYINLRMRKSFMINENLEGGAVHKNFIENAKRLI